MQSFKRKSGLDTRKWEAQALRNGDWLVVCLFMIAFWLWLCLPLKKTSHFSKYGNGVFLPFSSSVASDALCFFLFSDVMYYFKMKSEMFSFHFFSISGFWFLIFFSLNILNTYLIHCTPFDRWVWFYTISCILSMPPVALFAIARSLIPRQGANPVLYIYIC